MRHALGCGLLCGLLKSVTECSLSPLVTYVLEASFRNSIILSNVSASRFSYNLVHQDFV